jgi:hypothetical protein
MHHPNNSSTRSTPKKRSLESAAAEFIEKGWKLLSSVREKEEHPKAILKTLSIGDTNGM